MIEKLLNLQVLTEPRAQGLCQTGIPNPDRPIRSFREVVLYSPAFGKSRPGLPFPPWLIPARLRPPMLPEWDAFSSVRSDLSRNDLLNDDPFSRALRPCLRDPRRLDLLTVRRDLRPRDLDRVIDSQEIHLLRKRKDLNPGDLERLRLGIRSRLTGLVPSMTLGILTQQLTSRCAELMAERPDLKVGQLLKLLSALGRKIGPGAGHELPQRFLKALEQMHLDPLSTPKSVARSGSKKTKSTSSV